MCNCIETVTRLLQEKYEDDKLMLQGVSYSIDSELQLQHFMNGCYHYRKHTKSGDFCKNKTKADIIFSYCPFCGKKYEYENITEEN